MRQLVARVEEGADVAHRLADALDVLDQCQAVRNIRSFLNAGDKLPHPPTQLKPPLDPANPESRALAS